jgi:hypothetical protein
MARVSYEDFLRKQHPGIDEVAKLYADLGMDDAVEWAAMELKGKRNGVALALFCRCRAPLRRTTAPGVGASWELVAVHGEGQPVGSLSSLHELLGDI